MQIDNLSITRFRSIRNADIRIGRISALVGANNSGKSAVLRALNAFFHPEQERTHFDSNSHAYSPRSKARVAVTFSNLPRAQAMQALSQDDTLTLRASWESATSAPKYEILKRGRYLHVDDSALQTIRRYIDFVLVPPHRDPSRFKEQEQALLWKVVDAYLTKATDKRDTISRPFKEAAHYLESHQLKDIATTLTNVYASPDNISFRLAIANSHSFRSFVRNVEVFVSESDSEFLLEDCGTGVQSQVIISLHRLLARLEKRNVLIAIEEPETNLHPQAQQHMLSDLRASLDSSSSESQYLLTTHSTVAVDSLSHEDIVLIRKVPDDKRTFRTDASQLDASFWQRHNLDSLRYQKFHQFRSSDFFFAKLVLLVESATDADVYRHLLLRDGIDLLREGVSILPLDGKRSLRYAFHLFEELRIPRVIILDKDCFLPYLRDSKAASRDQYGWPCYKRQFAPEAMIEHLVPDASIHQPLLDSLHDHHTNALDILEQFDVVCLRWALEIDLVASSAGREYMYDFLVVPTHRRTTSELLVQRHKEIKRPDTLLHVINNIPMKNLPYSLSRVRNIVKRKLGY